MPTGYTADVQNGKVTSFKEFAMQCARAMGACIMMRDDPADAPIPDQFEPSDYHVKALAEAVQKRDEFAVMGDSEMIAMYEAEWAESVAYHERTEARKKAERGRYQAMLDKVNAWTPPTEEHTNFKAFMTEQLTSSINFDCRPYDPPKKDSFKDWRRKTGERLSHDVAYHQEHDREERERAAGRSKWVNDLRKSIQAIAE